MLQAISPISSRLNESDCSRTFLNQSLSHKTYAVRFHYLFSCWKFQSWKIVKIKFWRAKYVYTFSFASKDFEKQTFQQSSGQIEGRDLDVNFKLIWINENQILKNTLSCRPKNELSSLNLKIWSKLIPYSHGAAQIHMIVNAGIRPISNEIRNVLLKRSFLIPLPLYSGYKAFYRLNYAKKMLLKFKRDKEFEKYKGRILTVPNLLTFSRLTVAPLFPWFLLHHQNNLAFGLLVYCGATDIVCQSFIMHLCLVTFVCSLMDGLLENLIKSLFWALFWIPLQIN